MIFNNINNKKKMRTKVKRALALMTWLAAVMLLALACNDSLDITQMYTFDLLTMPYPKKVVQGETLEIRCRISSQSEFVVHH
jgi:hypothetical protein